MENKLEQLLNGLIEKGWKPFGHYDRMYLSNVSSYQYHKVEGIRSYFFVKGNGVGDNFSLRELTSKESGLWQFVYENGMVKKEGEYRAKRRHLHGWEHDEDVYHDISYTKNNYEYYIIESSLKDESELEEFLLDNIKV